MSIWPHVKILFHDIQDEIPMSNLTPMLSYIEDENDSKEPIMTETSINFLHTLESNKRDNKQHHLDLLQEFLTFLKWVEDQFKEIQDGIRENIPFPNKYKLREYECIIILTTLTFDRWYENNQKTQQRPEYHKYAYVIWHLQMGYRLWSRWPLMNKNAQTFTPAWFPTSYYRKCPYFSVPDGYDNVPVIFWSPDRCRKAAMLLTRDRRSCDKLTLANKVISEKFEEYRTAILDNMMITAFFKFPGPVTKLSPENPNHFILCTNDTAQLELEILANANNTASGDQRAVNEIRENYNKKLRDETEAYIDKENKKEGLLKFASTEDMLESIKANKKIAIFDVERAIKDLQNTYNYISTTGLSEDAAYSKLSEAELEESDIATNQYLEKIQNDINELKKFLLSEQAIVEQQIEEQKQKEMSDFISGISKSQVTEIYAPAVIWYKENMIVSHYLYIWNRQTKRINPFTPQRTHAHRILFHKILDSMPRLSQLEFMNKADEWVRSRSVDFWERERFRTISSGSSEFKTEEARQYSRTDIGDNDSIKNRGLSFDEIIQSSDLVLRYKLLDYTVYWWLKQIFNKVEIDRNVFYWELEYEYVNLRRPTLPSPIITKIGSTWCVFKGGTHWGEEWLNVTWCGPDIIDCLVEWLRYVAVDDWRIVDRESNAILELKDLDIQTLTQQFDFPEFKKT